MTPSIYTLFILCVIITCLFTPLIRYISLRKGFVDCPQRARKVHQQATPRLGGASILSSFTVVSLFAGLSVPEFRDMLWGSHPFLGFILLGSFGIFIIGFFDDLSRLSPRTKLLGEFIIAALVVWSAKFSFSEIQFLGLGTILIPEWIGFGLASLWIVGMANAINLIDGLDGLASGITLLGLLAVTVVGYLAGIPGITWFSVLLIGCLLGFLVFNSRPASIFLGDCGSLTLGYLAGCLSLVASSRGDGVIDGIFPFLAFAIPITDCIFAIVRRMINGRSPFSPDMEHFHHRLIAKGLSHGKAVLAMWAAAFSCSLVAIAAAFGKGDQLFAIFVFFGLGGFILLRYLGYFRFEFIGQNLSTLLEDRKSIRSAEQCVKEAEAMLYETTNFEKIPLILEKAALGMQFHEALITFYEEDGKLGSRMEADDYVVGRKILWKNSQSSGFYSRDNEFVAEFPISGRHYKYGKVLYRFIDNRSKLEVHDEVLFERINDGISVFAAKIRKQDKI